MAASSNVVSSNVVSSNVVSSNVVSANVVSANVVSANAASPNAASPNVMSRKVFVNLSVKDLAASVAFWTALGFKFDHRFTDEHAACMLLSDEGFVMLLDEPRFKDFTKKDIAVAATHTEVINAFSANSREEVEELVRLALVNGGKPANEPMDYGFMFGASFQDLDDHQWEIIWMDPAALENSPA